MVWKIGPEAIVFTLPDDVCGLCDGVSSCIEARRQAVRYLSEQGITAKGQLEVQVFRYGDKRLVVAFCQPDTDCIELFRFQDTTDLLAAYESENRDLAGSLVLWGGHYYAALFAPESHTLYEYAQSIEDAKKYYPFLLEHGTMISEAYLFS